MKTLLFPLLLSLMLSVGNAAPSAKASQQQANSSTGGIKLIGIDSKGVPFDFQNTKGKTVLLTFYSAGCTACERDLKLMREFYRDNRQRNFLMIGVNLEKRKEDFDSYARIVSIAAPANQQFHLLWKGHLKTIEGLGNIKNDPTHFVINKNGEIVLKREGMFRSEDWDFLWESIDGP